MYIKYLPLFRFLLLKKGEKTIHSSFVERQLVSATTQIYVRIREPAQVFQINTFYSVLRGPTPGKEVIMKDPFYIF